MPLLGIRLLRIIYSKNDSCRRNVFYNQCPTVKPLLSQSRDYLLGFGGHTIGDRTMPANLHVLATTLAIVSVPCWPADASLSTTFVKKIGMDSYAEVPVLKARITDPNIGIRMEQSGVVDGDHLLHLTVFDGAGRQLEDEILTITAKGGHWGFAEFRTYDPKRDAPGEWWYVGELDGKPLFSKSLLLEPAQVNKPLR